MKIPTLAGFALAFLFSSFTAQADPAGKQLFLLIGQSNMAGRGALDPADKPSPDIFMLKQDGTWAPALDPLHFDKPKVAGVGPGLSFARALAAKGITPIGLIPCAVGGSSLDQWKPGGKMYNDAVARAKIAQKDGTLVGILWHQGESDSTAPKVATYADRFSKMIAQLRSDLGAPNVPVIIGELGRFRPNGESDAFNANLPAVAQAVPNCAFVTTEDLTDRGDHLHFNTASARTLGERYAAAYLKLSAAH